jgi:hypothetical protein
MSECSICTEEEFCSDACAAADEPCVHGDLEELMAADEANPVLCRCRDCGAIVNAWTVTR